MLNIYLWGAALTAVAAVVFAGDVRAPALLAGLLWPVVLVGLAQLLAIRLLAETVRSAQPSAGVVEPVETWDRVPVAAGSR